MHNDDNLSITEHLEKVFTSAIANAYPCFCNVRAIIAAVNVSSPFGDYQCNNAMGLSKKMKIEGIIKAARDIAVDIQKCIPESPIIEKLEVSSAGFINIFLSKYIKVFFQIYIYTYIYIYVICIFSLGSLLCAL